MMRLAQILRRFALRRAERTFVRTGSVGHLRRLLLRSLRGPEPIPIDYERIRSRLFGMYDGHWATGRVDADDHLLRTSRDFLMTAQPTASRDDWRRWLSNARPCAFELDLPTMVALRTILDKDLVSDLDGDDVRFLQVACRSLLEASLPSGERIADNVEALVTIVQIYTALGTEAPGKILDRVAREVAVATPRVTVDRDEDAIALPLCGPGSPNGVAVTFFLGPENQAERLVAAGVTPDPVVNQLVLSALYACALACEDEPLLAVTGAAHLRINDDHSTPLTKGGAIKGVSFGQSGFLVPSDVATLDIDARNSLLTAHEFLRSLQGATGLIHVAHYPAIDARKERQRMAAAMSDSSSDTVTIIATAPDPADVPVVDLIPMLHRTPADRCAPVQIPVPLAVLGFDRLDRLLAAVRESHIRGLEESCRGREMMAKHVVADEEKKREIWRRMTEAERNKLCEQSPSIDIEFDLDFDLGLRRRKRATQRVPRREFEEKTRPELIASAHAYATKFARLRERLESLNRPGGAGDTLALKALVDALLRQEPPKTALKRLTSDIEGWVRQSSPLVRYIVQDWLRARGIPEDVLNARNVVFNPRIDAGGQQLLIDVSFQCDLSDYEACVDGKVGYLVVRSPVRRASLREEFRHVDDAEDVESIWSRFSVWCAGTFAQAGDVNAVRVDVERRIMSKPGPAGMVKVHRAKRSLLRGDTDGAIRDLESVRGLDLPQIYFWSAVAHQCRATKLAGDWPSDADDPPNLALVKHAVWMIHGRALALVGKQNGEEVPETWPKELLIMGTGQEIKVSMPTARKRHQLDREAEARLKQLLARSPRFGDVIHPSRTINVSAWEELWNVPLVQAETNELAHAKAAMGVFELINLAGTLRAAAEKFEPDRGNDTSRRDSMRKLLKTLDETSFATVDLDSEIRDLARVVLGGSEDA